MAGAAGARRASRSARCSARGSRPLVLSDGNAVALRAGLRADRGAAGRRHLRRRASRASARALRRRCGDAPAFTAVDGVLGAALTAAVGARRRVDPRRARRLRAARADLRREVQRSEVLQQLNDDPAAVRPAAERARALRPVPAHRRAGGRASRRRARASTARPAGRGGQGSVVQDPRHGLRARRRGLGLGRRPRARGHQRARGGRRGRHARAGARRGAVAARAGGRVRLRATTSRSCASTGWRPTRCAIASARAARHRGGGARLPAQRPLRRARRRASGRRAASSRRTPTARGRSRARSSPARPRALRQLRRAAGRRRRARSSARSSPRPRAAPAAATRCPNASRARRAARGAPAAVSTGPCTR